MEAEEGGKINRILRIYTRLLNGYTVNKTEEALRFGVNERSIQRDIDDIRDYLDISEEIGLHNSVLYDRVAKGYRLEYAYKSSLTNGEILAICKILLDSRAFLKSDMEDILDKLIVGCVPKGNQKLVKELVGNELFHYVELQHKNQVLDTLWELAQAVRDCRYIEMDYWRQKDRSMVTRRLKPVAIMFSEFYFYLTAFIEDEEVRADFDVMEDSFPTIYRVDRIKALRVTEEHFHIPYSSRFEEGEFRKRIQFMYGGKIRKVRFKYCGENIEAVLDRLPTAKVLGCENGVYTVSAEVFGKGIDMWLRSQGESVEVI